jgi:HAD superfamily hydrolase (TIGR01509 family)
MTLLIYDCDGVLVDSEPIACAVLADLITSLGRRIDAAEAMRLFGGRRLADVMELAAQMLGRPIPPDAGAAAARDLLARFRRELKPVVGAAEAISALPFARCVASSSAPERLRLSLEVTGLAPLFGEFVYSASQVANGKPAPDLFLFAAAQAGAHPSRCIVIEDTVPGIMAARAAAMATVGFAGAGHATSDLVDELTAAGADRVITTMADLPATIRLLVAGQQAET